MTMRNLGVSIRDRLLNKARAEKRDYNLMLTRYALERMIYRISISPYRDQFLLKGALLFDLWFDVPHRPTRDVDFLGYGPADIPHLESVFRDLCAIDANDGIEFQAKTVKAAEIRKEANYAGVRVTLIGVLAGAKCPVQADIGFGDAVVPGPEEVTYPVLLDDNPAPQLRAYPRYTVVAEKLEASVSLGMLNSRMKDYFDLWVLVTYAEFDNAILKKAIQATFERRGTPLPANLPIGLSDEFANDGQKNKQWLAFLHKNGIAPKPLAEIVTDLRNFLWPLLMQ
ncbi:MAG: nucleotidyl transferase AbiEii/AbiGii toxin family protein [Planctomycetales bacterium]|nr:nucleotidyl transferase AbiEii/AbiGii toxin family protein [Planctomycetales bacterium]